MRGFSIFRASFDGSLRPHERKRARFAALIVTVTGVLVAAGGFLAMLHMSSDSLSEMASAREVRILGAKEAIADKPCEEQTWPFIAGRCLAKADPQKEGDRTTPKHGLDSREVALPARGKKAASQETSEQSSQQSSQQPSQKSSQPKPTAQTAATTGAASASEQSATEATSATTGAAPQRAASAPAAEPEAAQKPEPTAAVNRLDARRARAEERREARRRSREQRREVSSEARSARAEARDEDVLKRWTEYTYTSPSGRSRRVIVIQEGSRDDEFFRTIR